MLIGKKVSLRALEENDLPQLRDWRNNENFRKYFREFRELNLIDQKKWFDSQVVKNEQTIMFGVLDTQTQELIGVCGLCYINWAYRNADLSLYIGKDQIYIDT
ncbi:GNAT family N-acetyltransferase, partial [Patescibacteria group bacterium]|nr:GNAT family N-acetyltransferase [Patescibacteria group bacterium]